MGEVAWLWRKAYAGGKKKTEDEPEVTHSDLYYFCIGEIGMSPNEFWRLTEGETQAKIRGWHYQRAYDADNFRSLYTLLYNINVKKGHQRTKEQIWGLIIDRKDRPELTHDEIVERNQRIRKIMEV